MGDSLSLSFQNIQGLPKFNVPNMAQIQHYRGFLVLLPLVGIAAGALELNSAATFISNTIALIPLGSWINRSVDALSVNGRQTVNEILKSTLGNSVELMVISSA